MWRLGSGTDWAEIAQLSTDWANAHELTLAREFVDRLDTLPDAETGTILFEVEGADDAGKALRRRPDQGAQATRRSWACRPSSGIPDRPEGPAVACRVRLTGTEATVQVASSDGTAAKWVPFGKFTLPVAKDAGKVEAAKFGDALAEGVLSRLVRAQLRRGPQVKGKPTYQVRIENASPLILNGLAVLGTGDAEGETPKELSGICIAPRRSMTVPGDRGGRQDPRPPQGHPRHRRRPQRTLTPPRGRHLGSERRNRPGRHGPGRFLFLMTSTRHQTSVE